jgi:hypothetical protein
MRRDGFAVSHHQLRVIDIMHTSESARDSQSPNPSIKPQQEPQESLTFLQMVGSILASFFGVQSGKNRERDFKHGKARAFIMVGILMTVVWYATIYLIVHVVLKH